LALFGSLIFRLELSEMGQDMQFDGRQCLNWITVCAICTRAPASMCVDSRAHVWWEDCQWETTDMNGGLGAILNKNGQPALTISLAYNDAELVSDIFITLNPDNLAHLEPVNIY
jgi:hypothetical protein